MFVVSAYCCPTRVPNSIKEKKCYAVPNGQKMRPHMKLKTISVPLWSGSISSSRAESAVAVFGVHEWFSLA